MADKPDDQRMAVAGALLAVGTGIAEARALIARTMIHLVNELEHDENDAAVIAADAVIVYALFLAALNDPEWAQGIVARLRPGYEDQDQARSYDDIAVIVRHLITARTWP